MAPPDVELQMTKGSKYKIESLASRDKSVLTHGEFLGFAMMGNVDAIAIRLDASHNELAGKVRFIPSHMIVTLDVIEAKKEEPEKETKKSERAYHI